MDLSTDLLKKVNDVVNDLKNEINQDGDFEALNIAFKDDGLKEIEEFSQYIRNNFKKVLILGIGGSSLGAKTLLSVKKQNKVQILENIDSELMKDAFNSLDLNTTAIITISKSGKTIECISQTLILLKMYEDKLGIDSIKNHFFFLTEDKDSPLTQLSKEFGIKTLKHHKTIGGRFSYLSNVALIPACIAGLDIKSIRDGARETIQYLFNDANNFITNIVAKQDTLYKNDVVANIMMTYCEKLVCLTDWYRQLWAESTGKNGFGIIPVPALGTVDQHSQLQMYMDGAKNLFFTFFLKEKDNNALKITKSYNKEFDYLVGKNLDDIMEIEAQSTIEVLNSRKLPIRIIKLQDINEKSVSQLMMQFILETIIISRLNNINPFGQPSVEERKRLSYKMYRK